MNDTQSAAIERTTTAATAEPAPARGVTRRHEVARGIEVDVVADIGRDRRAELRRSRDRNETAIGPKHPAPAPRRQPTIGEQEHDQREQRYRRDPHRLQQHRLRCKREPSAVAVMEHRVGAEIVAEEEQQDRRNQHPADRVARLATRTTTPTTV